MAGLTKRLFGRTPAPETDPLPGQGGYTAPPGRTGEGGFSGSTALTRTFRGASPRDAKVRADTDTGITPVTRARAEMQHNSPAEFYGGQPLKTRPGFDLAGINPLSGAAADGGHSVREGETPMTARQPQISLGTPGAGNVRNEIAQRYKNAPGQLHEYQSASRGDLPPVNPNGQDSSGNVHPDRAASPVTVPNRFVFAGGGVQTWYMEREMPYGGRGDGARGADLNGQRYYATGAPQFLNAGMGQYGAARLAGPNHRPTMFQEPAPWSANYYDTTAEVGTPAAPGTPGQAPGLVYVSPSAGRASNSTGRTG
jgi:hypothetical protein